MVDELMMSNFSDRLYVGGFSSSICSQQIRQTICQAAQPFQVSIEIVENGQKRHRGFAFVQCQNESEAILLLNKFSTVFIKVNFAKREPKPPETIMSNISNVFVRGISKDMTDAELLDAFGGASEGVVQCHVADGYGFVLFDTRENARKKIEQMDGMVLKNNRISVTWARPDTVGRKRKRLPEIPLLIPAPIIKRPTFTPLFQPSPMLPYPLFLPQPPQIDMSLLNLLF
ncbi:unnamed protein product [Caenorhabditis angaria]|uniref:RRM domain-containing protein n=1 Tax=Caenorhabditis angaria TaxID=860376 RepID=A0A9P1INA6_9PELO|nr:unnamed protein product [Caenorhabditis angaria]